MLVMEYTDDEWDRMIHEARGVYFAVEYTPTGRVVYDCLQLADAIRLAQSLGAQRDVLFV